MIMTISTQYQLQNEDYFERFGKGKSKGKAHPITGHEGPEEE
jgi:hypothetical protein